VPTPDEASGASLAHYLGLIGFIGPLIIMLTKGNESRWVRVNAVEALNFHLTMIGAYIVASVLGCLLAVLTLGIGGILWLVPLVAQIVFSILGGVAASKGENYRYPFNIRMVK
jgi:uncharacterized Tic20 family protein